MRITVKAFGPEITTLVSRIKVIDVESGSTVDDLIHILEEEIRAEHGLDLLMLEAPLSILVNGRRHEASCQKALEEDDVVTIISPIGGG
jgi:molybdopterin converting factor small subunit